jgi:hypothetical protein
LLLRWRQLLLLFLRHIALSPFQSCTWQVATAHAGEDQRDKVRRDTSAQRGAENIMLDAALLEA